MVKMTPLPQMKSIWLDEDEEAEKLYGLQAHFMGPDDDDSLSIRLINSDRPLLSNKKKIDLGPHEKGRFRMPRSPGSKLHSNINSSSRSGGSDYRDSKSKHMNNLFSLFKGKEIHMKNKKISKPFQFQHISHADPKTGFESEDADKKGKFLNPRCTVEQPRRRDSEHSTVPEEGILNKNLSASARVSYNGSISTSSSSRISRFSNGATGRIVSTSTMATSIQNDHYSRIASLNNLNKNYMKHRRLESTEGAGNNEMDNNDRTLDFLKNYDFPSGLNNDDPFGLVPEMGLHKVSSPIMEDESRHSKELASIRLNKYNKSDPNLLSTPRMQATWLDESTPATRRSLDEVLKCYQESSEGGSPLHLALEAGSPLQAAIEEQSIYVETPVDFDFDSSISATSSLRLSIDR